MTSDQLQGRLQELTGTTLDAQGAANVLAGTSGLDLVGALNVWAGTSGRAFGYLRDLVMAGINVRVVTEGSTTTDATSFATASIPRYANRLYLAFLGIGKTGGATNHATITNWTEVSFDQQGTGNTAHQVLRRMSATDIASAALTIDFAGVSQGALAWHIVEITGVLTTGTNGANAVVEAVTGEATGSGSVSLTGVTSGNATIGGMAMNSSIATNFTGFGSSLTQTGTTEVVATPSLGTAVGFSSTGSVTMQVNMAGAQAWSGTIIELVHA